MSHYPEVLVPPEESAPCGRRVRGQLGGEWVFDTDHAVYVWEIPPYPQYYVPLADVRADVLVDTGKSHRTRRGVVGERDVRAGGVERPGAAKVFGDDAPERLRGTVRFAFEALDAWFEEDEQIHVHPRNPYARVDALRSNRPVRVELDGTVLAEAPSSVLVFETGLPPRHYLEPTALRHEHLMASETQTACPYKGVTSGYWSVVAGDTTHADLAWSYAFPTLALQPIAGLVCFYAEKVDTFVDGRLQERPTTHFS